MAVTEGNIPVGETGKKLDTTVVEQTDGTDVHREVVVLADPETLANYAKVAADTTYNAIGAHMRNPMDHELHDLLREMITEQRIMNFHLSLLTDNQIKESDIDVDN